MYEKRDYKLQIWKPLAKADRKEDFYLWALKRKHLLEIYCRSARKHHKHLKAMGLKFRCELVIDSESPLIKLTRVLRDQKRKAAETAAAPAITKEKALSSSIFLSRAASLVYSSVERVLPSSLLTIATISSYCSSSLRFLA